MKIQISKDELASMLQSTYNIDLTSGNYEITIEGYTLKTESKEEQRKKIAKQLLNSVYGKVVTDFMYADTDSIKL